MEREALKLTLEALEEYADQEGKTRAADEAITAIKAALAQPAQEPVAWMSEENDCIFFDADKPNPMDYDFWTPLYTAPPQRPWVGLTGEDFSTIKFPAEMRFPAEFRAGARWAEDKLKEKNEKAA